MRSARAATSSPAGREAFEGAAITHEQREAELLFKQTDLLADARLGSVQRLGGSGDVEAVLHHGREISKLLQLQIESPQRIDVVVS